MKLISWNVNGIRAAMEKGFMESFNALDADVFCLNETKLQEGQIALDLPGYYQYWNYAEKKGYSGVAIFTRIQPDRVVVGMNNPKYDCQGRVIRADYGDVTVVCVYIPSGEAEGPKYHYKMEFLEDFLLLQFVIIMENSIVFVHKLIELETFLLQQTSRKVLGQIQLLLKVQKELTQVYFLMMTEQFGTLEQDLLQKVVNITETGKSGFNKLILTLENCLEIQKAFGVVH